MAFDLNTFISGLGGFGSGILGDSSKPFDAYSNEYKNWLNKGTQTQQPYLNAGGKAIGNYEDWLEGQKNPTEFINKMMGDYSASPYAQYLQQQSMRAGQNAASASGLMGSTPLMEQLQTNANNISSQDMNTWLQNVLGINTQYGQGQQNLVNTGQNAANALTNMYGQAGKDLGEAAYGSQAGKQNNLWNTIGGAIGMASGLGFL